MPSDLDQLAQDANHQDRWQTPRWNNDLGTLAGQQQMTHQPEQPNPAAPWLAGARAIGGIPLEMLRGFNQNIGRMVTGTPEEQGQASGRFILDTLGMMPFGGVEKGALAGTTLYANQFTNPWRPWELQFLKKLYSMDIDPYSFAGLLRKYLPGKTTASIYGKAFQLGLKRPKIPPYVRPPGSPSVANDPQRSAQLAELLKKGMSSTEIASRMGDVSPRTVRRYINENLKRPRAAGRGGSAIPPGMPKFSFQDEVVKGDPDYERTLLEYLRKLQQ